MLSSFVYHVSLNQGFVRKSLYRVHFASVHEGKKPNMCDICGAGFSLKSSLRIHIDGVHEGNIFRVI